MNGERQERLRAALAERVLVLDGAMGTMIQAAGLGPDDFGGDQREGCNEVLVRTRPQAIREIHARFLEAGADIVETDTFGGTPLVLDEYGLGAEARELNRLAAVLAREVAADFSAGGRLRFVAGSMGPTTRAISVTGGIGFHELREHYREQALGLIEGGADYLLLETVQDTRNAKAGILGIAEAKRRLGVEIPVAISATIETMGTTLAGQTIEAFLTSLLHAGPLYVGLNCATGPAAMSDHLRALAHLAPVPVAAVPNAGLPDENGRYGETPEGMAATLRRFLDEQWIDLVGGCCGTTPAHTAAFAALAAGRRPRPLPALHGRSFLSGLENLELAEDNRPLLVGERTNVIGSRRFKTLVKERDFEAASEIARRQVRGGAQVLDICLADPDGDEAGDMERFLERVVRKVKVPLMLDSTDAEVFARALTWCQGKAILNSINLEDGEERFERVVPLARSFGAALVVGCIDEDPQQGMAVTRERKLGIAERAHDLLVEKYGVPPADIVFDPLVFPCATGDVAYIGSARETVEGVRLIKQALPQCRTILGVSNVSFGLPAAAREVVNSVFLHHATRAGLDLAIVNTERLERYAGLAEQDRRLAERVLFETDAAAIAEITARFRQAAPRAARSAGPELSLDERLARYVVEGSREGLLADLDLKLREAAALDIINGPLMKGMDEVGRLFAANELIVAEVLQSAEVMKAAVDHLEPHLEKTGAPRKGTMILATVKGDVHDIGKNLVDIIFANNGYRIVNLGIKVPPQRLIEAIREHRPDLLGLSGLLVKSTAQMVATAEELTAAGLTPPLLVGGAALTKSFAARRIAPAYGGTVIYAQDAMDGLSLADRLLDARKRPALEAEWGEYRRSLAGPDGAGEPAAAAPPTARSAVRVLDSVPAPASWERQVRELDLDAVWPFVNPAMLYNRHLGLKGKFARLVEAGDAKAVKLVRLIQEIQAEGRAGGMHARAVWQAFQAESDGDTIRLYRHGDREPAGAFAFPRQNTGERLCLSDYVRPAGGDGAGTDNVVLFVVSAGEGIRPRATALKESGEYLRSHALQALALETAEAAAEWLHAELRRQWGFPDPPGTPMIDLFRAKYPGRRYSFGYPACPELEDQRLLFELLRPEEIGVRLTEGLMMDPEASVSALVFHHPEAVYFSVGSRELPAD